MDQELTAQQKVDKFREAGYELELVVAFSEKSTKEPTDTAKQLLQMYKKEIFDYILQETKGKDLHLLGVNHHPLELHHIRRCIQLIDDGNAEVKAHFTRWINNPILYQTKLIKCLKEQ